MRENFKKISTLYYQELSEQTFYSENDLREFAETHFSQNLKLGKTARIVSAETTSLTTNYSFEEIFSIVEDPTIKNYLLETFVKRSDSLALIEIQERLIHDVHITNETAEILILVTETLLSSSREHIDLETAKNFTDDILRDGEDDCGSLNECNSDCRKQFNDDMEYAAGSFGMGLIGIGIGSGVPGVGTLVGGLIGAAVGGGLYYRDYNRAATVRENYFFKCDQENPCK